ncbi:MAG: PQQ-binding-like beta-propeller repeat protein, partial [Ignavibacteriaceae bacterium]
NGKIYSSPLIENDLLVAATVEGDVLTLNANNGNPVQVIGIGESITSDIAFVDFEESGANRKAIVLGTVYGNLYCYDLFTLEPAWTTQITNEWINSSIVYSNKKIFFQDKEGTVYCLSSKNGLLIWKISAAQGGWKTSSSNSYSNFKTDMVVKNNNLYLIDVTGNLFCIDALLGTNKWDIKNINYTGLIRLKEKNELLLSTAKNKIVTVSTKLGKVTSEIEFPADTKSAEITDLQVIGDNILIGFSDGWVYRVKPKQKPEKFFRGGSAPIVSLLEISGKCLVTDYDGNFTLLNIK